MSGISGLNINSFISKGMENVDGMSTKLNAKMQEIVASGAEMKQEDLLVLQYEMGQYQAMMTALNNTVHAIQSQVKELAQSIR